MKLFKSILTVISASALSLSAFAVDKNFPNDKVAILTNGSEIKYDKCLLAIGGKPKSLDVIEKSE